MPSYRVLVDSLSQACQQNSNSKTIRILNDLGDSGVNQLLLDTSTSPSMNHPLFIASSLGFSTVVESILNAFHAKINERQIVSSISSPQSSCPLLLRTSEQKISPLSVAIRNGHSSVIRAFIKFTTMLIQKDPSSSLLRKNLISLFNAEDAEGQTPLSLAISTHNNSNSLQITRLLLDCTFVDCNGYTSSNNNTDSRCNNNNADDRNQTTRYSSYLWQVCNSGDLEVVKMLLDRPDCDIHLASLYGTTPLQIACAKGRDVVVQTILDCRDRFPAAEKDNSDEVHKRLFLEKDLEGRNCLFFAAMNGHVNVVERLLNIFASSNSENCDEIFFKDNQGSTALIEASANGHDEVVQLFLSRCRTNNAEDQKFQQRQHSRSGATAFTAACREGHLAVVEEFISVNSDNNLITNLLLECDFDGMTGLHHACANHHLEIVEALMKILEVLPDQKLASQIADNTSTESDRPSPIFKAVENGCYEVVDFLLRFEIINPLLRVETSSNNGALSNCCFAACQYGHIDILVSLFSWSIRPNEFIDPFAESSLRLPDRCSPLSIAAENGHDEVVQLLLMRGRAALMMMKNQKMQESDSEDEEDEDENEIEDRQTIQLRKILDAPSVDGITPVYCACDSGNVSTLSLLLNGNCDPEIKTNSGWTPLMIAVYKGHFECIAELLSRNGNEITTVVNVNAALPQSSTSVLHFACSSREIPDEIEQQDFDDDDDDHHHHYQEITHYYKSIMSSSSANYNQIQQSPREKIVRLLLRNKADPNVKTFPHSMTPLHYCAQENHNECARALLEAGADIFAVNSKKQTALDLAKKRGQDLDITRFLELVEEQFNKKKIKLEVRDERRRHVMEMFWRIREFIEKFSMGNDAAAWNSLVEKECLLSVSSLQFLIKNHFRDIEVLAKTYLDEKTVEFNHQSKSLSASNNNKSDDDDDVVVLDSSLFTKLLNQHELSAEFFLSEMKQEFRKSVAKMENISIDKELLAEVVIESLVKDMEVTSWKFHQRKEELMNQCLKN